MQIPGSWCEIYGTYPVIGKKTDGSSWIWGQGCYGQIGNNTTNCYSSPIALPGTWIQFYKHSGGGTLTAGGIKSDNTLWLWGLNDHGQIPDNTTNWKSSPIQVPGTWKSVGYAGDRGIAAIKTDGTLWGWGHNTEQRFHCSEINYSSPIQLPGTNWLEVGGGSQSGTYLRF